MLVVNDMKGRISVGKVPQGTLVRYLDSYYIVSTKSNGYVYIHNVTGNSSELISIKETVIAYKATIHIEGVLNEV